MRWSLAELQRRDAGHVRLALDACSRSGRSPGCPSSVPLPVAKTSVAVSPDWAGNRWVRRSTAFWDSVPGVLKLSTKAPPPSADAAADGDEERRDDREGAFPVPRGRGGETSKYVGHALHGITLAAKLQ